MKFTEYCTENEKQQLYVYKIILSVPVVSCHDGAADRERLLTATDQHHQRTVLHTASLGKDQNSKFKMWVLQNAYCFHTSKLEIP